jgi:hypothetical protein
LLPGVHATFVRDFSQVSTRQKKASNITPAYGLNQARRKILEAFMKPSRMDLQARWFFLTILVICRCIYSGFYTTASST